MELGKRLRQARLEQGISQRQLCGEMITRNMLSQIENGSARPSMDTLRYLAQRLRRPVSYFLEEDAVSSPNREAMDSARLAFVQKKWEDLLDRLEDYRTPDPIFDWEKALLESLALLALAEQALEQGKIPYARELLEKAEQAGASTPYYAQELERKRLILLGRSGQKVAERLPDLDEELLLRAQAALEKGLPEHAGYLLDAAQDQRTPQWTELRGQVYFIQERFEAAARCYHILEDTNPEKAAPMLESCYRELKDFEKAYFYACRARK